MNDDRLVLSIAEAASLARIGRSSMYEAVKTGRVASIRFGRIIKVPRAALERLLSGADFNPNAPANKTTTLK